MTQIAQYAPEPRIDGFLHRRVDAGEVTLHVAEARPRGIGGGPVPDDVPLVVLLHGFPEFWWSWRHQMKALSDAGYWAVAPDMRGYNESDKPKGVSSYEVEKLAGDVAGLIRALGRKDAIVVGHDWGGAVAWAFAHLHGEMVRRLSILNAPHPAGFTKALRRPAQLKRSWYMFFFQLPNVPERTLAKDDYAFVRKGFRADGISDEDIEHYVDAIRVPNAAESAINYYRAAIRRVFKRSLPEMKRFDRPVLVIWGDRDRYLGRELADPPPGLVPGARVVHIPEASHWVQNVAAEEVNRLLVSFVREEQTTGRT
jgi:pimeloyl-ACP methyl ester carboxylesterase